MQIIKQANKQMNNIFKECKFKINKF